MPYGRSAPLRLKDVRDVLKTHAGDGRNVSPDELAQLLGMKEGTQLAPLVALWTGCVSRVRVLRDTRGWIIAYRYVVDPLPAYSGRDVETLEAENEALRAENARLTCADHGAVAPTAGIPDA